MPDTLIIADAARRYGASVLDRLCRGAGSVVHQECAGYTEPSPKIGTAISLDFPRATGLLYRKYRLYRLYGDKRVLENAKTEWRSVPTLRVRATCYTCYTTGNGKV